MSEPHPQVQIRRVRPDEVEVYRAFRLRALADSPDAFSDTVAAASARPLCAWEQRVAENSAGLVSVLMVAVDATSDAWLGMTGSFFEEPGSDEAGVVSVWVAPEARRRGLARQLLEAAGAGAHERGAQRLRLWVVATNLGARTLYERAGFVPTGAACALPSNPALQEVEMTRSAPGNSGAALT